MARIVEVVAPPGAAITVGVTGSSLPAPVRFLVSSAAASLAGAILISTKRSAFTSGVMIGLALIPAAAIAAVAATMGEPGTAGKAFLRWLVDVALIASVSFAYFGLERFRWLKKPISR
jgi:hypothetical protein